jgi:hypothetical protein
MAAVAEKEAALRGEQLRRDGIVIRTYDLWKTYVMGDQEIHAVSGIDVEVKRGEYVAIMGPSGSGKSTLMNLIGCLDSPTKGEYFINGNLVSDMSDDDLARIRNKEIGFVFQTFNLLPRATSLHNVELPLIYAGLSAEKRIEMAKHAMQQVDLERRMHHKPNELSGSSTTHPSCSPTSPPALSTPPPAMKSWASSSACTSAATPSSSSPTSTTLPCTPTASSRSATAKSSATRKSSKAGCQPAPPIVQSAEALVRPKSRPP